MPSSTFQVVHEWPNYVATKEVTVAGDTFKVVLTNSTPTAAGTTVLADITPITEQNGYTAWAPTMTWAETGAGTGIWRLSIGADKTWTASGGNFGPFRYAVLYDDTTTTPDDAVVGYWDYGSAITVSTGETFTIDVDANFAVYTVTVS